MRRKYFAALSRELSFPSSQRSFRGRRNPEGGGPAGVADLEDEVERVATVVLAEKGQITRDEARALRSLEAGRARASIANGLVEAIMDVKAIIAELVAD